MLQYYHHLYPGCSLGIGDWRILWLLHRILQLEFVCFMREVCPSIIILQLLYSLLLLLQFLMKTLPPPPKNSHFRLKLACFKHQNHKSCFREIFRSKSVYYTFQASEKQNNFNVMYTWIIKNTTHFLQKDLYFTKALGPELKTIQT